MQALIVEGSRNLRWLLRSILTGAGFRVIEANGGADALACLRRYRADLGFFECDMPGMDGIELMEKVRANPLCSDMKIVMVTSKCPHGEASCGRCDRADECLRKPFTREKILHKLETIGIIH
jgi:CheY-like chemotaxis protein